MRIYFSIEEYRMLKLAWFVHGFEVTGCKENRKGVQKGKRQKRVKLYSFTKGLPKGGLQSSITNCLVFRSIVQLLMSTKSIHASQGANILESLLVPEKMLHIGHISDFMID